MAFLNGQGRRVLVNTSVVASHGTLPTSIVFGTFLVSEFQGICGFVKADSNFAASLRFNYLQDSGGSTLVSSTLAVTSGIVVNEFNPAPYVQISVQGISSNSPISATLTGLPVR
jgi:hypothetical protein